MKETLVTVGSQAPSAADRPDFALQQISTFGNGDPPTTIAALFHDSC